MASSLLRNAFNRVMAARERQARSYANGVLIGMDDASIKALGTSREELRREGSTRSIL